MMPESQRSSCGVVIGINCSAALAQALGHSLFEVWKFGLVQRRLPPRIAFDRFRFVDEIPQEAAQGFNGCDARIVDLESGHGSKRRNFGYLVGRVKASDIKAGAWCKEANLLGEDNRQRLR